MLRLGTAAWSGSAEAPPIAARTMLSPADDIELMVQVARGEPAAQRVLVRRLLHRIQRVCRALLRNRVDAEDAAQLSVIEVLKSARNFLGESSLERWSDRITARDRKSVV